METCYFTQDIKRFNIGPGLATPSPAVTLTLDGQKAEGSVSKTLQGNGAVCTSTLLKL